MKKKFLALVLTLAMVLSLAPVGALATNGGESQTPEDVIYDNAAHKGNATVDGVDSLNKTAVKTEGENTYNVTLEVKMYETTSTISQAAATVLVIDISNSMGCTKTEHKHTDECYETEKIKCTAKSNPEHWVVEKGILGKYPRHKDERDNFQSECKYDYLHLGYYYDGETKLTCGKEEHSYNDNCHTRLTDAKDAARAFVETYAGSVPNAGRNLAIVLFNRDASVALPWTDASTNKANVLNAINNISLGDKSAGSTNLEQGLSKAKELLSDSSLKDISKDNKNIIALTDGAPTHAKDASHRIGDGYSGSAEINEATSTTATAVKNLANLYTVCFGAENTETYSGGPTVGKFLKKSIATDSNHAYNADNADKLNKAFEKISQTITSGLSAGTVHDALPKGVSSDAFNGKTTADWYLNTFDKQTSDEGNTKHYTYTKTYTVTIDPDKIDTSKLENGYYPLNDRTTLTVKTGDTNTVLDFPIPAGKVTAKINYELDGGTNASTNPATYVYGVGVQSFADATKSGYTFGGWYSDPEFTTEVKSISATATGDKTLYAKWEAQSYNINYELDGGTNASTNPATYVYGVGVQSFADATRSDYTFGGWYSDPEFTTEVKSISATATGDKTLYAKWEAQSYNINYELDGGTNASTNPATYVYGVGVQSFADATKSGYTFGGWYSDPEFTTEVKSISATATGDKTLYAKWEAQSYNINYELDGGTNASTNPATYVYGVGVQSFADATKSGYTFGGWYSDPEFTTEVKSISATATGDKTLYAKWEAQSYNINYELDGGTNASTNPATYVYGVGVQSFADATKSGYTFGGWYSDNTFKTKVENIGTTESGNKTLYAKWEKNLNYTIIQHFRDGKGNPSAANPDITINKTTTDAQATLDSLITDDLKQSKTGTDDKTYVYVPSETKFTVNSGAVTALVDGTEIHLYYYLDETGNPGKDSEGKDIDTPNDQPDAWEYKATFIVKNGQWDTNPTGGSDIIVKYLPTKNITTGESIQAKLSNVPTAGNTPDSHYKAGSWDQEPNEGEVITKDMTYTYTYSWRSSGGSGGSNRPKPPVVEIPDDVPTGLNGKDHYAYVVGYPDGMVYPQKNITRAEVATIFFRLLTDETREANMTKSNSYNDMKDGAWYTCAVSTLSKMGIIKGYEDGSFKPDASISRAEFAAIAARFDPNGDKTPATFSDVSSHWAKDEISIAANHGWIKGYEDGSFKPDQKITRAETMTLVNRVLKRLPETKDDLHKDMKTWPDNQNESAWFYLAVQEATNSHYQKLKKDGIHETWESMRETRDWAALEK